MIKIILKRIATGLETIDEANVRNDWLGKEEAILATIQAKIIAKIPPIRIVIQPSEEIVFLAICLGKDKIRMLIIFDATANIMTGVKVNNATL